MVYMRYGQYDCGSVYTCRVIVCHPFFQAKNLFGTIIAIRFNCYSVSRPVKLLALFQTKRNNSVLSGCDTINNTCNHIPSKTMPPVMERNIKLWEFIIGIVAIFITVGGIVYNRGTMDAQNEVKIIMLQQQFDEFKKNQQSDLEKLNIKLDRQAEATNQILILLQNKEDRKK